MAKQAAGKKSKTMPEVEKAIASAVERLKEIRGRPCYPLLLTTATIGPALVDDIYDDLRRDYGADCGELDVVVYSGGGDIDAAYNLGQLLRRFASARLSFIVPRWAKSAATLLVCAGDTIEMTPVAELGPMDPVITVMNPLERRLEQFSPLHIDATLQLIRDEYKTGNEKLADGLMKRLQFPLTLGSFKMSLELAKQYLIALLSSRMLKDQPDQAKQIAKRLTEGYADHGFCINVQEARQMGLKAAELSGDELDVAWEIQRLVRRKHEIERQKKSREVAKKLKELPPEVLEKLPPDLFRQPGQSEEALSG